MSLLKKNIDTNSHAIGKIDTLQVMRAFAAISVMLFHGTGIIERELNYTFLDHFFSAGFSGVDVFFVISGFVIYYTATAKPMTRAQFLKKRFLRIYPVYWVVTLLLIVMYIIAPVAEQARRGDGETIVKSFFLYPQEEHILALAWTLTYEIIFYLLFAITFYVSKRTFFITFAAWSGWIIIANIFNLRSGNYAIDSLSSTIILNFGLGTIIAYSYFNLRPPKYYFPFIIIGLTWFGAGWYLYYMSYDPVTATSRFTDHFTRVYLFGIPTAIFMFGIIRMKVKVKSLFVHLGNSSYSLYLVHGTIIALLTKIIFKIGVGGYFSNIGGALLIYVATLVAASLFYTLVENPLLKLLSRVTRSFNPKPTIAGLAREVATDQVNKVHEDRKLQQK